MRDLAVVQQRWVFEALCFGLSVPLYAVYARSHYTLCMQGCKKTKWQIMRKFAAVQMCVLKAFCIKSSSIPRSTLYASMYELTCVHMCVFNASCTQALLPQVGFSFSISDRSLSVHHARRLSIPLCLTNVVNIKYLFLSHCDFTLQSLWCDEWKSFQHRV